MTTPSIEERLRRMASRPAPDVWPDAMEREPRALPRSGAGARVTAAIVALVVALAGFGAAFLALSNRGPSEPTDSSVPGGRIVFAAPGGETWQLFATAPDGTDVEQLTHIEAPFVLHDPAWSPDGTQLAYVVRRSDTDRGAIWVSEADGSGARPVTGDMHAAEPSWSPDGSRIAFTRIDGADATQVWIADVQTGRAEPFTLCSPPECLGDSSPAWSPDGTTIAFVRHSGAGAVTPADIYVWPVNDGDAENIGYANIERADYVGDLTWSPDGSRIAMTVAAADSSAIYVVDSSPDAPMFDGTDERGVPQRLSTPDDLSVSGPTWSPDGAKIAFVVSTEGRDRLYTANADGTDALPVPSLPHAVSSPAWQPIAVPSVVDEDVRLSYHDQDDGLSLLTPSGWTVREDPVPRLVEPRVLLAAGSWEWPTGGDCAPTKAIEHLPADGAFVWLIEYTSAQDEADFPQRPQAFSLAGIEPTFPECSAVEGVEQYLLRFSDAGRFFQFQVAFGAGASEITRAEALTAMDSLTVASGSPEPGEAEVYEDPLGWTAEVPSDWHVLPFSGNDRVSVQGVSFSNVALDAAADGMHPDLSTLFPDGGVALIISHRDGGPAPDYLSDDSSFPLNWSDLEAMPGGLVVGSSLRFRANGTDFTVEVAARSDAPEELLRSLQAILESIHPAPLTEGDRVPAGYIPVRSSLVEAVGSGTVVDLKAGPFMLIHAPGGYYALELPSEVPPSSEFTWDESTQEVVWLDEGEVFARFDRGGTPTFGPPGADLVSLELHPVVRAWDGVHLLLHPDAGYGPLPAAMWG